MIAFAAFRRLFRLFPLKKQNLGLLMREVGDSVPNAGVRCQQYAPTVGPGQSKQRLSSLEGSSSTLPALALAHSLQPPMPAELRDAVVCVPLHPLRRACVSASSHFPGTSLPLGYPYDIYFDVGGVHGVRRMRVAFGQSHNSPHSRCGTCGLCVSPGVQK